ncbi:KilA-N DNA-binding domain-containing protein [uncultured virus]|nr:KilA-N DNA-binding domain-containing protein [uncultured virus]
MSAIDPVTYQDIDADYAYANYLGLRVVIMKANGYINMTKILSMYGKVYKDWKRVQDQQKYVKYIAGLFGLAQNQMIIPIDGGKVATRGKYVHHQAVTKIATWCSDELTYRIHNIVIDYVNKKAIDEMKKTILEQTKKLEEKDVIIHKHEEKLDHKRTKISDLKQLLQEFRDESNQRITQVLEQNTKTHKQNAKLEKQNVTTHKRLATVTTKLTTTETKLTAVNTKLDNVSTTLRDVSKDHVVKSKSIRHTNYIIIVKTNAANHNHIVMRVMRKSKKNQMEHHTKLNGPLVTIDEFDTPNAMNLWVRAKNELKKKKEVEIARNGHVKLIGITSEQFALKLRAKHEERMNKANAILGVDADDVSSNSSSLIGDSSNSSNSEAEELE